MTDRFTSDLGFILFVLLIAAILGFLLGYYIRKAMRCKKCIELEKENEAHKHTITKLEEELTAAKFRIEKLLEGTNFDAALAKSIMGQVVKINDLEIVEGIGPKIAGILRNRGIKTWKALSEARPDDIFNWLITDGGEQYRIHVPDTWPEQALLAHEGNWHDLKELQDKLVGGKEAK